VRTDDGRERSYRLFVPVGDLGSAPLLVALHGGLGSAAQFAANSGYDGLATSNRFLVVYPDGVGRLADGSGGAQTWNGGACCGPAVSKDVDDVAFLRALVAEVSASYPVDPNRVYAAGHSNGGIMALRLACEASDVFVAVGVQSAALGVTACRPPTPVSLLQIHGTADTKVPIGGGRGSGLARVDFAPPRDAAGTLAAADGCDASPTTTADAANPDLELSAWPGCAGGSVVEFLTVEGAGHAWMGHPASSPLAARLVGTPYPDLDSSRALWSFLAAHPRG
jgi:polyhydroxybutyrate depolymerase